ncbi:hypothetical protein H5410_032913 [Solanum commersonii]|uniref:AIPP2-like SPOC-like domain-containing protein n=1 Tax=Solanum commersonii TaxID=4109 RepID=A0A9J5YP88_SOLCO|nr:hypothetical protein H5410_032913 [Solanum commersonii]
MSSKDLATTNGVAKNFIKGYPIGHPAVYVAPPGNNHEMRPGNNQHLKSRFEEEEHISSPARSKLSPQITIFVLEKIHEPEIVVSRLSPNTTYDGDLGSEMFDEDDEDDMLDILFDKVSKDRDISPRQQRSGSNKSKKKTHERQHSWDGKEDKREILQVTLHGESISFDSYICKMKFERNHSSTEIFIDKFLFEVFKRLPSGSETSAYACVSKRWLTLLSSVHKDEITESKRYLARSLVGRKVTVSRLAAIAIRTSKHGGLAKISIRGNNVCRGVTDVGFKDISRGFPTLRELSLWNVSSVGDESLSEIVHGCHLLEKLDLFQCPRNRGPGGSTCLEHRSPDAVNESRMMNSSRTHTCDPTLVPSRKYCMLGYYVDTPVNWCCEECDIGKGIMSSSRGLEIVHYEGSKLHASEKIFQSIMQPKKHSKFPGGHCFNREKEVRTGKLRYLHVEEALDLSSSIKKYGSPLIDTVSSRVVSTKSMATMTRRIFSKPRAQISNFFRPDGSTSLEHRSPDVVNKSRMMNASMTHPYDHALVPSQKQAHPSSRARRKVYEFSVRKKGQFLPYISIRKGAMGCKVEEPPCPGTFLLEIDSHFPLYVVEFMRSKDLVMRTLINVVKLYILASTTMCTNSRMDWCCEECDIRKGIMSSSSGLENVHYEGSKLHAFENICQSTVQPKKHSKFPRAHRINGEKEVQTGKMRYLPVEEALGLSSSNKKYGSTLINTVSSRVTSTKSIATITRGIFSKPRPQISNSFRNKSKVQLPLASTGYTKPQTLRIAKNTEHSKKDVQLSKGLGSSTSLEHTSPDDLNKSQMMNSSMTHPCDPSRKGSSDILGALEFVLRMLNSCIQAHSPSRVRRKVYEFSGHLPDTLKFELVPRGVRKKCQLLPYISIRKWAMGCKVEVPPCPGRSERYIALVEFMRSEDLVMRTLINDVELLILASTAMCTDSQMDWCCEEYDISKGIMSTSSGLENVHYEGSKLHAFENIC